MGNHGHADAYLVEVRLIRHSVLSPLPLRVSPMAGNFLSLHATASGKVLLSHLEDEHMQGVGAVVISLETSRGYYSVSVVGPSWRLDERKAEIESALCATRDEMLKTFRSLA